MFKKLLAYTGALAFLWQTGCAPDQTIPALSVGDANMSKFVVVGDSYASGYKDNAYFRGGQDSCFTTMLYQQFKLAGATTGFGLPTLPDGVGFGTPIIKGGENARYAMRKYVDCTGNLVLEPAVIADHGDNNVLTKLSPAVVAQMNNFAVPLSRAVHQTDNKLSQLFNSPNYNPYFERFATNDLTSPLDMAVAAQPTFFTVWVGAGDYMLYAVGGGKKDAKGMLGDLEIDVPDIFKITETADFEKAIDDILSRMTGTGAKGVIANLPDITSLPHFSTVPYDTLTLTQEQADALNAKWAGTPNVSFKAGRNALLVRDSKNIVRQITADEKVVLMGMPKIKCEKLGSEEPLPHEYFLEQEEWDKCRAAMTSFNQIIAQKAAAYNVPLVDMYAFFKTLEGKGTTAQGIPMNKNFVTGGFFSLDGAFPNARGHAMIANEFIRVINEKYNAKIPNVNVSNYTGAIFP